MSNIDKIKKIFNNFKILCNPVNADSYCKTNRYIILFASPIIVFIWMSISGLFALMIYSMVYGKTYNMYTGCYYDQFTRPCEDPDYKNEMFCCDSENNHNMYTTQLPCRITPANFFGNCFGAGIVLECALSLIFCVILMIKHLLMPFYEQYNIVDSKYQNDGNYEVAESINLDAIEITENI